MEEILSVKGRVFGKGKPLICIPVMKNTKEEIVNEIKMLKTHSIDMIEWRVDSFKDAKNLNAIRGVLQELEPLVKDVILVYTFRSKAQGGLMQLDANKIYDIHQIAAETKVADFVDVEFFEAKHPEYEIAQLQEMGIYVIASHHDFQETPESKVVQMLLEKMNHSGADVVKLAVMPQTTSDVLRLLEETNHFHQMHPKKPLITMSMGAMGCISRVAGEVFGSCVTFGTMGQSSAPGQLPADKLEIILESLHACI